MAFWNVVLDSGNLAARMTGRLSSCFAAGLVHYWPLQNTSDLTGHAGSEDLTNGT